MHFKPFQAILDHVFSTFCWVASLGTSREKISKIVLTFCCIAWCHKKAFQDLQRRAVGKSWKEQILPYSNIEIKLENSMDAEMRGCGAEWQEMQEGGGMWHYRWHPDTWPRTCGCVVSLHVCTICVSALFAEMSSPCLATTLAIHVYLAWNSAIPHFKCSP